MKLPVGYVPGIGVHKPTAYGGFGEKLLKQLGWSDGKGLGAQGTGITSALRVLKKEDTIGVGASQSVRQRDSGWWEDAYNSAAQVIAGEAASTSGSDSETAFGDDDTKGTVSALNQDGTLASCTAKELRMAQELAKDPWGRFGGRGGKLARIRRQEAAALAAMTGVSGATTEPALRVKRTLDKSSAAEVANPPRKRARKLENANPSASKASDELPMKKEKKQKACKQARQAAEEPLVGKRKASQKRKKQADEAEASGLVRTTAGMPQLGQKGAMEEGLGNRLEEGNVQGAAQSEVGSTAEPRAARVVVQVEVPADAPVSILKPTPRHDWWGASKFVSSGCLEGLDHTKELVANERQTFTEDTQADLYNQAQSTKTAGKKGLGRVAGSGKPVGSDWKGTRVVFDDAEAAQPVKDLHTDGIEPPIKWKKLAKQALLQAPKQKMKLPQLLEKMCRLASSKQQAMLRNLSDGEAILEDKVMSSAQFIVKGTIVKLAGC